MIRMYVICEGPTEEMFIKDVVSAWFNPKDISLIPISIGGNVSYQRLFKHLQNLLLRDKTSYCTTFFDFYGSREDFPGKQAANEKSNITEKAGCLLSGFSAKLQSDLGAEPLRRFIPYVQMYEFEGLLFSDTKAFADGINQQRLKNNLADIRIKFTTPEHINNSCETAPSKRIIKLFPEYEKPLHGTLAALEIGLDAIRKECLLFDAWLKQIEALLA